jgi:hypothetical protein
VGASRVKAAGLRVPAIAVLVLLIVWSILDAAQIGDVRARQAFDAILALAILSTILGWRFRSIILRRLGLLFVALAYFGAHAYWLPIEAAAAVGFLVLVIAHVELRILAERFAPLYLRDLDPIDLARMRGGLLRAILRIGSASTMAFLLPIFAGELALAGTIPLTTIPTAVALAAALITVLVLLALLPTLERRRA